MLDRLRQPQQPARARGLLLSGARALLEQIAEQLDGEVAGDVRRWADAPHDLVVAVSSDAPDPVLDGFERLPVIVSVVERESDEPWV